MADEFTNAKHKRSPDYHVIVEFSGVKKGDSNMINWRVFPSTRDFSYKYLAEVLLDAHENGQFIDEDGEPVDEDGEPVDPS